MLLSETFWRSRFGADPASSGRRSLLDLRPRTVVGVVSDSVLSRRVKVWVPLAWTPADRAVRDNHNYRGVAKLKPGVPLSARRPISTRLPAAGAAVSRRQQGLGRAGVPLHDDLVGDARPALLILLGAVALVLLIACANLANLMLVRTHGRAREIALRGGARRQPARASCSSCWPKACGSASAAASPASWRPRRRRLADGGLRPGAAARAGSVVDGRVLGFTAVLAILTGLAAAFAPAWQLTGRDANDVLKQGASRGSSSGGDGRVRNLLVISEVALALMLLIGAGLMMRSLNGLRGVDPGFDPRNLLSADHRLPDQRYGTPELRNQFFDRALAGTRAIPGVESAAWIDSCRCRAARRSTSPRKARLRCRPPSCRWSRSGSRHRTISAPLAFRS